MTVYTMMNFQLSPPPLNLLLFRLPDLTATNGPLCKEKERNITNEMHKILPGASLFINLFKFLFYDTNTPI